MTFRDAYCVRFGVPPDAFEKQVLWDCLYPHARTLARLLLRVRPGYFGPDRNLIRAVANCSTLNDVGAELNAHCYHVPPRGFWRRLLRVRMSGESLMALGAELLR